MKLDKDFYVGHIQGEDYIFKMKKVLDDVEMVLNNYRLESTDFLDPYERYLASSILNRFDDIKYFEDGGLEESERKVINIYPYYMQKNDIEDKISFLKIDFPNVQLIHKDFLGAILNMGITREKTGDIYVHDNHAFLIIKKEISGYILYNLEKVSNYKVKLYEIKRDELQVPKIEFRETSIFISSLRLDSILSGIYKLSRQNSLKLIKADRVKVNFKPVNKPSIELKEGDLISVRGYGRATFHSIIGTSKKGNYNITFRILV